MSAPIFNFSDIFKNIYESIKIEDSNTILQKKYSDLQAKFDQYNYVEISSVLITKLIDSDKKLVLYYNSNLKPFNDTKISNAYNELLAELLYLQYSIFIDNLSLVNTDELNKQLIKLIGDKIINTKEIIKEKINTSQKKQK